ncbi:MAG: hypothetical protein IH945_01810 [Armatimonadetes bacterium]|nr:hypothetical protein [Armatimonadota bacterium]
MTYLIPLLMLAAPQASVELKLKLREDETVRYRHVLNVTMFLPDGINERVASGVMAFTIGAEVDGRIPITMRMESFEGLDPGSNGAGQAMSRIELSFDTDKRGRVGPVSHEVPQPGLRPVGELLSRTLTGLNSLGFLGWNMPDAKIATGHKWTRKVAAADYLSAVLAPGGGMFNVDGEFEATFQLVDVINVNDKPHARVSIDVKGEAEIEINNPNNPLRGTMVLEATTSLVIDLSTGLVTRSKTDGGAEIDLGQAQIQIVILELLYKR